MTTPFHTAFRDQLLKAAERETKKRRRRIRAAIAAAIAAVVGAGSLLALPDPASADVKVTVIDGYIEVTLRGPTTTNGELLGALRDHHINALVKAVPTGPSAVGRFTAASVTDDPAAPQVNVLGPAGSSFSGFHVRDDFTGQLLIELGRPATQGEAYEAFTNAFDAGEPLHCAGVLGQRLTDVGDHLAGLAITVRIDTSQGSEIAPLAQVLASPEATDYITAGRATSPDSIELAVAPHPEGTDVGC